MDNLKARQQQNAFARALHEAVYAEDIATVENAKRKSLITRRKRQREVAESKRTRQRQIDDPNYKAYTSD